MDLSFIEGLAPEPSAAQLRRLSDEMNRLSATLARLATVPGGDSAPANDADLPNVPVEAVHGIIEARRLRAKYFSDDLFADPAWDMLLDLFQAELARLRIPVSSLCIAASVPATTALRWINTMTDVGLFVRRRDPHDGRRVFIELSPQASEGMHRYFGALRKPQPVEA